MKKKWSQPSGLGLRLCQTVVLWLSLASLVPLDIYAEDYEVQFLDGKVLNVQRFALQGDMVELIQNEVRSTVNRLELQSIRRRTTDRPKVQMSLGLVDGSELVLEDIVGSGDKWQATTPLGPITIPKGNASWLLLRRPVGKEEAAWRDNLESTRDTDLLIIAREQGVLDRAGGEVMEIDVDRVKFDFDGQKIDAPRPKLLGVLWYRKPLEKVLPSVRIRTRDGSQWFAIDFQSTAGDIPKLQWKTVGEITVTAPLSDILEVDFSSANLKWLADVTMIDFALDSRSSNDLFAARKDFFRPRFAALASSFGNSATAEHDLGFPLPGSATFRVPTGFRNFEAAIRRASQGDARATIDAELWENDRKIWEGRLGPDQDQLPVKASVEAEKRLKFVVSAGNGLMAGSQLIWLQPRFLR